MGRESLSLSLALFLALSFSLPLCRVKDAIRCKMIERCLEPYCGEGVSFSPLSATVHSIGCHSIRRVIQMEAPLRILNVSGNVSVLLVYL